MTEYITITIDVEPDCSPSWRYSDPLRFSGIRVGIAEKLQPLFNKYDFTPTYLINNVALEDQESVEVFQQLQGNFELGTHLHPEFIEPAKEISNYAGKKGEANCCFYPPEIEFQKIKNITELFRQKFGFNPTSFRAGRFSAGRNTIASLTRLGYKVDTSVTPRITWNDKTRQKPVDFRKAPLQPYWIDARSMVRASASKELLEVPVTIGLTKLTVTEQLRYLINNKVLPIQGSRPQWLRPKFSDFQELTNVLSQIKRQHTQNKFVVYNMMFHNVEVMPGLSPYSVNEEDSRLYMQLLDRFVSYCSENNIKSVRASDLYEKFRDR